MKAIILCLGFMIFSFITSYIWQSVYFLDFYPPYCSAQLLLHGQKPYDPCPLNWEGAPGNIYPMTTVLAFVPFAWMTPRVAMALFWALSNGLLLFGVIRAGGLWRLLIFVSSPYIMAFLYGQFSPLIAAVMLLPDLLPLAMVKPQIGLPVIITNLNRRRLLGCVVFSLLTLAIYPAWLLDWWRDARNYYAFVPLLVFPVLILAAFKWRDKDARYIFLMSLMPQRNVYDTLGLFLTTKTARQAVILVVLSWVAVVVLLAIGIGSVYHQVLISAIVIYLPSIAKYFIKDTRFWLNTRMGVSQMRSEGNNVKS